MQDILTPGLLGGHLIENDHPVDAADVATSRKMPHAIDGMRLFSLGLVYWSSGFDKDLVFQFESDADLKTFNYDVPVLDVTGWENILQALPSAVFDRFLQYMLTLSFSDPVNKRLYAVDASQVKVRDVPVVFFFCRSNAGWYVPGLVPERQVVAPTLRPADKELIHVARGLFKPV